MNNQPANLVSMPRKQLTSHLLQLYGWRPIAIILLISIPALAAGIFHDIRWLIVFFLVICVAAPMVMAFIFIFHGLRPSTASNLTPHTIEIKNDGIHVSIYRSTEDDGFELITTHIYTFNTVRRILASPDSVTVRLLPPEKGFIWIPIEAFPSKDKALDAFREIVEKSSLGE